MPGAEFSMVPIAFFVEGPAFSIDYSYGLYVLH